MPGCATIECTNSAKKGFLMKHVPKDPQRRKLWLVKLKRDNWVPINYSCICECCVYGIGAYYIIMAGALFNILIPTKQHEFHLSRNVTCDCSTKNSAQNSNVNIHVKKSLNFTPSISMEKVLEAILSNLQIANSVWTHSKDNKFHSVTFSMASNEHCERIMDLFIENGIGVKLNSVVVVLPCSLYYQDLGSVQPNFETNLQHEKSSNLYESSWKKFLQSARSRLTVAQVVQGIEAGAMLTIDYLILLFISVTVAALGLMQGEIIIFVSSMLLSPLMGPINAATFGTITKDKHLRNMGIVNEFIGLLLCVMIGFGYGLITSYFDQRDSSEWVTDEMAYMTDIGSLWVSIVLALLIGIAVPIAILGNNTFSLVGVAISTSLLPPSVNAGLLWAFSMRSMNQVSNNNINLQYSTIRSTDFAIKGGMSMCLTFINIICIFGCGIIILKIKSISPKKHNYTITPINDYLNALRDINLPEEETNYLTLRLEEEYASVFGSSSNSLTTRRSCFNPGYNPFDLSLVTWSPGYNRRQHNLKSFSNIQASKLLKKNMGNIDPHNLESSPRSLKAIFESPKENYSTVSSDNAHSSTKRFIITPVTLKNTSNS